MSSPIWMQCAEKSNQRPLDLSGERFVDDQFVLSTRRLVDSLAEQAVLEEMLEKSKPPIPTGAEFEGLDPFLSTPFRYPPLEYGSRFGSRIERGLWYGSVDIQTALAEVAFYRFLFLEQTKANLGLITVSFTSLAAKIKTSRGMDLGLPPFDKFRKQITSRTSYRETQRLGRTMRSAGVKTFVYPSARDPRQTGNNVALFTPKAFAKKVPISYEYWNCIFSKLSVEFVCKEPYKYPPFLFSRIDFLVQGKIVTPSPE